MNVSRANHISTTLTSTGRPVAFPLPFPSSSPTTYAPISLFHFLCPKTHCKAHSTHSIVMTSITFATVLFFVFAAAAAATPSFATAGSVSSSSSSKAAAAAAAADMWAALRKGISAWEALDFDKTFAVQAGTVDGNAFTYTSSDFDLSKTRMLGASLSKWPSAVMISGLVEDGTMSFDDKANKYLKWWAKDGSGDHRAGVTLRQLLSFTSGLLKDYEEPCVGTFMVCAQKMYEGLPVREWKRPNTTWTYLSGHLQFAGAMAVEASGKEIQQLYKEYLYEPYNMTGTSWQPFWNPTIAVGITTTAADFRNLLEGLLEHKPLSKSTLAQMERDYSKAPVSPSGDGWFGHYGMGHWWECLG